MSGEVLRIGPFVGGLNLASDVSSVADEELVICKNFELDIDGSLKNRPPFSTSSIVTANRDGMRVIGNAVFDGTGYLFASGVTGINERIAFSTSGTGWSGDVSTSRFALTSVQYANKVWFPSAPLSTAANGANWDPVAGATAIASMPKGSDCVIHKERMFIVPGKTATTDRSRLYFSDPAALDTWPGTSFIDVSPGDGQSLNAVLVYNDNLLLFKDTSVYVLAFDIDPADAILRQINPVLGAEEGDDVIQFENVVYALHGDIVYEVVNYDFNPINIKVPFVLDTIVPTGLTRSQDTCLSIIGERLVIKYFSHMYVYGLRTKTWSEWLVTEDPDNFWHDTTKFIELPGTTDYFAMRAFTTTAVVIKMPKNPTITDGELTGDTELMSCIIKTKDFDMADPVHFKRLFWWSADILSGNTIIGRVFPVTYTFSPLWSDMSMTWDEIEGSWNQPTEIPLATVTTYTPDNNFVLAKTVKFMKSLRFRKISFEIELSTNGRSTSNTKLFSLTVTVLTKQRIVQGVS